MKTETRKVSSPEDLRHCLAIRFKVFVEGQNVPLHEESDGNDKTSEHYLLLIDEIPAATARVRYMADYAKIERVAVLNEYQGQGCGRHIMDAILHALQFNSFVNRAQLSSQVHAIPFYEKLGFKVCSDQYLDAGIPHKDMYYELNHK